MSSTFAKRDLEERSRSSKSGGGGARAGGGVAAEPGRDIRRNHGSQYRNTQRICINKNNYYFASKIIICMVALVIFIFNALIGYIWLYLFSKKYSNNNNIKKILF